MYRGQFCDTIHYTQLCELPPNRSDARIPAKTLKFNDQRNEIRSFPS